MSGSRGEASKVQGSDPVAPAHTEEWLEYFDNSRGLPYYYNTATQETRWTNPAEDGIEGPDGGEGGEGSVADPWDAYWDGTHQRWYYVRGEETVWEVPDGTVVHHEDAEFAPESPKSEPPAMKRRMSALKRLSASPGGLSAALGSVSPAAPRETDATIKAETTPKKSPGDGLKKKGSARRRSSLAALSKVQAASPSSRLSDMLTGSQTPQQNEDSTDANNAYAINEKNKEKEKEKAEGSPVTVEPAPATPSALDTGIRNSITAYLEDHPRPSDVTDIGDEQSAAIGADTGEEKVEDFKEQVDPDYGNKVFVNSKTRRATLTDHAANSSVVSSDAVEKPEDFEEKYDESAGYPYYENKITKRTTWTDHKSAATVVKEAQSVEVENPEDFEEKFDDASGYPYYENKVTKRATWTDVRTAAAIVEKVQTLEGVADAVEEKPEDFEEKFDHASGHPYYENRMTKRATWTDRRTATAVVEKANVQPQVTNDEKPEDFEEKFDEDSGHKYYENRATKRATWTAPRPPTSPAPLWQPHIDPTSSATYYYNTKTHEVTWEMPKELRVESPKKPPTSPEPPQPQPPKSIPRKKSSSSIFIENPREAAREEERRKAREEIILQCVGTMRETVKKGRAHLETMEARIIEEYTGAMEGLQDRCENLQAAGVSTAKHSKRLVEMQAEVRKSINVAEERAGEIKSTLHRSVSARRRRQEAAGDRVSRREKKLSMFELTCDQAVVSEPGNTGTRTKHPDRRIRVGSAAAMEPDGTMRRTRRVKFDARKI